MNEKIARAAGMERHFAAPRTPEEVAEIVEDAELKAALFGNAWAIRHADGGITVTITDPTANPPGRSDGDPSA